MKKAAFWRYERVRQEQQQVCSILIVHFCWPFLHSLSWEMGSLRFSILETVCTPLYIVHSALTNFKKCKFSNMHYFTLKDKINGLSFFFKTVTQKKKNSMNTYFSLWSTLFINKRFALNEMFQRNVSKFAIFYA